MSFECLEEFDLLLLDCPRLQSKQTVAAHQSCNHRDITPVEMKLGDGCLTFERPSAYRCRSLAYPGLVDKSNDSALSLGSALPGTTERLIRPNIFVTMTSYLGPIYMLLI